MVLCIKLSSHRRGNYAIETQDDLEKILEDLNPVQQQVGRITKEFCNLLDATRPLSGPIRLDILEKAWVSINNHKNKAQALCESSAQAKHRLTTKLLKRRSKHSASRLQHV